MTVRSKYARRWDGARGRASRLAELTPAGTRRARPRGSVAADQVASAMLASDSSAGPPLGGRRSTTR